MFRVRFTCLFPVQIVLASFGEIGFRLHNKRVFCNLLVFPVNRGISSPTLSEKFFDPEIAEDDAGRIIEVSSSVFPEQVTIPTAFFVGIPS